MIEIDKKKTDEDDSEVLSVGRALGLVYQIGFTIIFSLLFFMFVGKKIDEWLGTSMLFTLIGIIFGVVGGGYVVYKEISKIQ